MWCLTHKSRHQEKRAALQAKKASPPPCARMAHLFTLRIRTHARAFLRELLWILPVKAVSQRKCGGGRAHRTTMYSATINSPIIGTDNSSNLIGNTSSVGQRVGRSGPVLGCYCNHNNTNNRERNNRRLFCRQAFQLTGRSRRRHRTKFPKASSC